MHNKYENTNIQWNVSDVFGHYARENVKTVLFMTPNVESSDMGEQRWENVLDIGVLKNQFYS